MTDQLETDHLKHHLLKIDILTSHYSQTNPALSRFYAWHGSDLINYARNFSASVSTTQCQHCISICLPEKSHYRIMPKMKVTKKILKLAQKAETNNTTKYQKHLLKCFMERRSKLVITCSICGKRSKITCPKQRQFPSQNTRTPKQENTEKKLSKSAKKKLKMKLKRKTQLEEDFVTSTPKLLDISQKKRKQKEACNFSGEHSILDNTTTKEPLEKLFSKQSQSSSTELQDSLTHIFTKSGGQGGFTEEVSNDSSFSSGSVLNSEKSVQKSSGNVSGNGSKSKNQRTAATSSNFTPKSTPRSLQTSSFSAPRSASFLPPTTARETGKTSAQKKKKGKNFHSQLNRMLAQAERKKSSSGTLSDFLSSI